MNNNRNLSLTLTRDFLEKEYLLNKKTIKEIAILVSCSWGVIDYYLKKWGIPIRNISEGKKGRKIGPQSEEHKRKRSESMLGRKQTKEHIAKLSLSRRKYSIVHCKDCKKQLKSHFSKRCRECYQLFKKGKNHPNWKGGISKFGYPIIFNKELKEKILKRDNYKCQLCPSEHLLSIHHIDYNKRNCSDKNLITLCRKCNSKVNFNRPKWAKYFFEKLGVLKLHICCGSIYLIGYDNLDIQGEIVTKDKDNLNQTTLFKYYKREFRTDSSKRIRPTYLIDKQMDPLKKWPYENNSIDEVVIISAIEHFYKKEAAFILREISRVLKIGGKLIIDFPNLALDIERYYEKNPEFLMELIYCNHKDQYSIHKWGYTFKSFKKLAGKCFKCQEKTFVKHSYPMTAVLATKIKDPNINKYNY